MIVFFIHDKKKRMSGGTEELKFSLSLSLLFEYLIVF